MCLVHEQIADHAVYALTGATGRALGGGSGMVPLRNRKTTHGKNTYSQEHRQADTRSKAAVVRDHLLTNAGATLDELCAATGWQS